MTECKKCGNKNLTKYNYTYKYVGVKGTRIHYKVNTFCKPCKRKWKQRWNARNKTHLYEYGLKYRSTNSEKIAAYPKRPYKNKYPEMKAKTPGRVKARTRVFHEMRMGRLKRQPCVWCGNKKTDAHHEDYRKPLDIIWFCRKCHLTRHSEKKRGLPLYAKRI